jgi:hypothetical protein
MRRPPMPLLAKICEAQRLPIDQLFAKYPHFLSGCSTRRVETIRQEVIYRLQEEYYDQHLSNEAVSVLNKALNEREEKNQTISKIASGTQYVRIWKGERHILTYRGPKQYEYRGKIYRSPSLVAQRITGSHWNGREFFKLPPLRELQEG